MRSNLRKTVVITTVLVGVAAATSTALAGTGVGGVFNLGKTNTVNAPTTLTGSTAGKQLQVTNTSTGSAATGVGITVASGKPPLTVNSATQVPNLNASLLGGKAASSFIQGTGNVTQSGLFVANPNSQVALGTILFGSLTGVCPSTSTQSVQVLLSTPISTETLFIASSTSPTEHFTINSPHVVGVLDQVAGGLATAQVSTFGATATITAAANVEQDGRCDFSVQTTTSHS
jgi:hypothetical protein